MTHTEDYWTPLTQALYNEDKITLIQRRDVKTYTFHTVDALGKPPRELSEADIDVLVGRLIEHYPGAPETARQRCKEVLRGWVLWAKSPASGDWSTT